MELGELVVIECVASDSSIIPLSPNGLMVHATTPRLASGIRPEAKSVEVCICTYTTGLLISNRRKSQSPFVYRQFMFV